MEFTHPTKRGPAFRWIRESDELPRYRDLPDNGTAMARVKLFNPMGLGTWYLAAIDDDGIAFGLCDLGFPELGLVSLHELANLGPIERDLHWSPRRLSEC